MSAYDILTTRGVTRLCHFTKFQNLTHIITSADGVLASSSIRQDTKNVNDTAVPKFVVLKKSYAE